MFIRTKIFPLSQAGLSTLGFIRTRSSNTFLNALNHYKYFSTSQKIAGQNEIDVLLNKQVTSGQPLEYGSRTIYLMYNFDVNMPHGQQRPDQFLEGYKMGIKSYWATSTAIKAGVAGLLYFCVHPLVSILPILWFFGTYQRMIDSISFGNKFVVRMDLINSEKLKVYFDNNEVVFCDPSQTKFFGITPMKRGKGVGLRLQFQEIEDQTEHRARMLVFSERSLVENVDLLKCIIHGNQEAIEQFEFNPNSE